MFEPQSSKNDIEKTAKKKSRSHPSCPVGPFQKLPKYHDDPPITKKLLEGDLDVLLGADGAAAVRGRRVAGGAWPEAVLDEGLARYVATGRAVLAIVAALAVALGIAHGRLHAYGTARIRLKLADVEGGVINILTKCELDLSFHRNAVGRIHLAAGAQGRAGDLRRARAGVDGVGLTRWDGGCIDGAVDDNVPPFAARPAVEAELFASGVDEVHAVLAAVGVDHAVGGDGLGVELLEDGGAEAVGSSLCAAGWGTTAILGCLLLLLLSALDFLLLRLVVVAGVLYLGDIGDRGGCRAWSGVVTARSATPGAELLAL